MLAVNLVDNIYHGLTVNYSGRRKMLPDVWCRSVATTGRLSLPKLECDFLELSGTRVKE